MKSAINPIDVLTLKSDASLPVTDNIAFVFVFIVVVLERSYISNLPSF